MDAREQLNSRHPCWHEPEAASMRGTGNQMDNFGLALDRERYRSELPGLVSSCHYDVRKSLSHLPKSAESARLTGKAAVRKFYSGTGELTKETDTENKAFNRKTRQDKTWQHRKGHKCRGTSSSKCALCTGLRFWKATTCLPAGRDARTSFGVRKPLPQTVSKPATRPCSLPARTGTHSAKG